MAVPSLTESLPLSNWIPFTRHRSGCGVPLVPDHHVAHRCRVHRMVWGPSEPWAS